MERRSPFIWNKCWDCAIGVDISLGKKSVRYWLAKGERRSEKGRTHTKTRKLQQCNIKLNWIKVNEWQIAQHWLHAAAARSNEERIGNDNRWNWRERIKKRIQIEFQTNENSGTNVTFSNADFSLARSPFLSLCLCFAPSLSLVDCKRLHLFSQFTIYDKL